MELVLSFKNVISVVDFLFVILIARQIVEMLKKAPTLDGKIASWAKPLLAFVVAFGVVALKQTGWLNDTFFVALAGMAGAGTVQDALKKGTTVVAPAPMDEYSTDDDMGDGEGA